jgi:chromate transport protein ChrA
MWRFMWDAVRLGLVAAGLYGAAVEPMILGSWVNLKIAMVVLVGLLTWNALRSNVDYRGAAFGALGTLGVISIVAGSQSWRPAAVVVAVGALMTSARARAPTLRRVRIHFEEERA